MAAQYTHSILAGHRVIIQRYRGPVSLADVQSSTTKLWADPAYDRTFDGISDLTQSTAAASVQDVKALHELVSRSAHCSTGRWAVITNDPAITALTILYSKICPQPSIAVFSTWSAACSHLHVALPLPP